MASPPRRSRVPVTRDAGAMIPRLNPKGPAQVSAFVSTSAFKIRFSVNCGVRHAFSRNKTQTNCSCLNPCNLDN